MLDLMLRDRNGDLLLWDHPSGVVHAVYPWMWTVCPRYDVPPSAELEPLPERKITCKACLAEIATLRRRERDAALIRAVCGKQGDR